MAISAKKLVYDFRRKMDFVLSGLGKDLPLVDVIAYLNEGQEIWLRAVVPLVETNERIRQDLRLLEVPEYCADCMDVKDGICVFEYPDDLFKVLNERATVTNEECCPGYTKDLPLRMQQSDDKNETLRQPYTRASFPWERLNADEKDAGLYVYHQNEMEVRTVCIDYIRKLQPIHAPTLEECVDGYYDYEGVKIIEDSDFELDCRYLDNKIVDIAVLLAKRDLGEFADFQIRLASILQIENLVKQ